jgi:hypothetical protein
VPESVVVRAGELSATFEVTTYPISAPTQVTITASLAGGVRSATLDLRRPVGTIDEISLLPASVLGGSSTRGVVRLTSSAPREGLIVKLESDSPSVVGLPASIRVSGGSLTASFTITTRPVAQPVTVSIAASVGAARSETTLTVNPPSISSLILRPNLVRGLRTVSGTLNLSAPAPAGGVRVALSSSDDSLVDVPAEVLVPAGARSATFRLTAQRTTTSTRVEVTAAANGLSKSAMLTLLEVP